MIKQIFSLLLMLCTVSTALAQTITGSVTDSSGKILPFATITLSDLRKSVTTDLKGHYTISQVPVGKHTLLLSYVGYESQTRDIDIVSDCTLNFTMKETSVNLNEVIVLPDGENVGLYLLKQVVSHKKDLKDILSSYNYTATCRMETDTDMKIFSKSQLRMVNFLLGVVGLKKIFVCMENHPDLRIEMAMDVAYSNGKKTTSDIYMKDFKPDNLTVDERAAFTKRDHWLLGTNPYDDCYFTLSNVYDWIQKDVKKGKHPIDSLVSYEGCYSEAGHIIHVIKIRNLGSRKREVHIVGGNWQIRRIITHNDLKDIKGVTYGEFQEQLPGIYLPVSVYQKSEWLLTQDEDYKKDTQKLAQTDTTQLSRRQLKKYQKKQRFYNRMAEKPSWSYKFSNMYNYKDIVAK